MRPLSQRVLSAALITIISAAILLALAGAVLSMVLARKVEARLLSVNAKIGSLRINLFTRGVRITDFEWTPQSDSVIDPDSVTSKPHHISVKDIHASGINFISLLRNREIKIKNLRIDEGIVYINNQFKAKEKEQKQVQDTIPLSSINIDRFTISNIDFTLGNDSLDEYHAGVGIILHQVTLDSVKNFRDPSAYRMRNIEATVQNVNIQTAGSLYNFTIEKISFDKELKKLRIDSLILQPLLDKTEFAKKVKSQQTRTEASISTIAAEGVNMAVHMQDTSIMITSVLISNPTVWAYKDKRYPFTRTENFPLPMEMFRAMHIGIEVDSIRIEDGTVTYEEFPEDGFKTGRITFDGLEATMSSLNNREFKNMSGYSTLKANAKIMKTGEINATFKLPLQADNKYQAEGTIKNLPLAELNPILKNVAFVEISSGQLNRLGFSFSYDDVGSTGKVNFDYQDLKILSLKKERGSHVAGFKTLVVNTAMKDDQVITGDISVARNQKKAVFNLWVISLADGLKSGLMPGRGQKSDKEKKPKKK
jgi:Domain of Unknown Function (DUF748)